MDFSPFKKVFRALAKQDELHNSMQIERFVRSHFGAALTTGPFAGLTYPEINHSGEQILVCKYLGTFERELFPVIGKILHKRYDVIHNIGSADGYYSVGFARHGVAERIVAWEMLPSMQKTTSSVAQANNVAGKIEIRGICEPSVFAKEVSNGPVLILADCEGAEDDLLTPEVLRGFASVDILVECHDLFNPGVTQRIIDRFKGTHDIEQVWTELRTLDQIPERLLKELPFSPILISRAIEEPRLYRQSWLWITPRA